ncbi:MAG TPA: BON domain-containing protein [Candidatus Limnocylindria bacterium]|nr:BON domain-containing protein [Candidatus Limnocylindria bacterium]
MANERSSDSVLQQDIIDELAAEGNLDGMTIAVGVRRGVVRLVGSVPSLAARLLAERAVGRIPGVQQVIDELTITSSVRPARRRTARKA